MAYQSRTLQEIPDIVSSADREQLSYARLFELHQASKTLLYERLARTYDSHPYFLVRMAEMVAAYRSGTIAIGLFRQAQARLRELGVEDKGLDMAVEEYARAVDAKVEDALRTSEKRTYYQTWKPTRQHKFPTNLPHCPSRHQDLKDQWTALVSESPSSNSSTTSFYQRYLRKLAIETNHIESTFLITEESARDIVQRGIDNGDVRWCYESALQDASKIRSILRDTLMACELLFPLADDPARLDRAALCRIHKSLMESCRITDSAYISPGVTRSTTRKTVVVESRAYSIQCCPFDQVDAELDIICNLAKQWTQTWRNPFATASWIHLILVRCHPFEDGNGRLTRLIASLPLVKHGYPPISIDLKQRPEYYDAINKAYTGDHSALSQCILQGAEETIKFVLSVK